MNDGMSKARRRAAALFVAALLAIGATLAFLPASASADGSNPSVDPSATPTQVVSPSPTDVPTPSPTDDPTPSPTQDPSPTGDPSPTDQPTPTEDPTPSATEDPTPTQTPSATEDPTATPTATPTWTGPLVPWPSPSHTLPPWLRDGVGKGAPRALRKDPGPLDARRAPGDSSWKGWVPSTAWGTYSTALLDAKAARLRAAGATEARILRHVYRPFIVQGPATWSDSWHAPRFVGGFHLHEGQDVLCSYGAPVLAALSGRLSFGENTLGGLAAYITMPNGSFLYYAHLSQQRTDRSGTQVHPGDVIGNCGATGDATVPHVHFSLYDAHNVAHDPMRLLVSLLHEAEQRATGARSKPNLAPKLPKGLILEADPPVTSTTAGAAAVPAVVNQAGLLGVGDHVGTWDILALIAAFGVFLVAAGLMRLPKVRAFAGLSDGP